MAAFVCVRRGWGENRGERVELGVCVCVCVYVVSRKGKGPTTALVFHYGSKSTLEVQERCVCWWCVWCVCVCVVASTAFAHERESRGNFGFRTLQQRQYGQGNASPKKHTTFVSSHTQLTPLTNSTSLINTQPHPPTASSLPPAPRIAFVIRARPFTPPVRH